jgi:hypothetical protein
VLSSSKNPVTIRNTGRSHNPEDYNIDLCETVVTLWVSQEPFLFFMTDTQPSPLLSFDPQRIQIQLS